MKLNDKFTCLCFTCMYSFLLILFKNHLVNAYSVQITALSVVED